MVWTWIVLESACIKGLVPTSTLSGCGGNIKRWGLMRGHQITGGMLFKGIMEPHPFLFLSSIPNHEVRTLLGHILT